MRTFCKVFLILLTLMSCSSSKKEGLLQEISSKSDTAPMAIIGELPRLFKKKKKNTVITGRCLFKENDFEYPVRYSKIKLFYGTREVFTTSSDHRGNFVIQTYLDDGDYHLAVESGDFRGELELKVDGVEHEGIKLIVTKGN